MAERRDTTRGSGHDPFNHPRDRRQRFRNNNEKLKGIEVGDRINLFSFVSRSSLPQAESGYIEKVDMDTTLITMIINGQKIVHTFEGVLDSKSLVQTMRQYMPVEKETIAVTVDSRSKIDGMVIEEANGFSTDSGLPAVGNREARHWVMFAWNNLTFWNDSLTADQYEFFKDNKAVIAEKRGPGAEPTLNYFKTVKDARDRMAVLGQEHGAV